MILENTLILKGNYEVIKDIRDELTKLNNQDKLSKLYLENCTKNIKKLIFTESSENYYYLLNVQFQYKGKNIEDFINLFNHYSVEVVHMCYNVKKQVWIVNKLDYIKQYNLVPTFAINEIIYDYMTYIDSSIVTDNYETIKYDRNMNQIVMNDKKLTDEEFASILFQKTLKGKPMIDVLEQFVYNYHEKCINSYQDLYAISKEETQTTEEPSPLALIIVTFGIFGIIALMMYLMGYIQF